MATVYIHYIFFPSFQFDSKKTSLCHLMLKATDFSWFWVFFACWFLVFLSCYFFSFFYSCTTATIGTITTITSSSASMGERTPKTNYKLWSFKFWSSEGRKEQATPKLVLLLALGLGNTRTHTHTHKVWLQYKICTRWCNPTYIYFPCTWVLRLTFGLCTPVCFWACNQVVNSPCSNSGRRRRKRE